MCIYSRTKLSMYLNGRLEHELQVGILKSFLELDVSEMKDPLSSIRFKEARGLVRTTDGGMSPAIKVFINYLGLFRQCTSIIASVATLVSLTNKSSWPVLGMIATLPFLNQLTSLIPGGKRHPSTAAMHLPLLM